MPGEPLWAFAFTDSNGYGHGCSIGHAHSNRYCDGNCYSDAYAYRIANAEDYAYTTAASYSTSSAVSLRACMQLSSETREAIREFPKSREPFISERVKPENEGGTALCSTC